MRARGDAPGKPGLAARGPLPRRPQTGSGTKKARRRLRPLREAMHRRVLELREAGLSYSQIIEKIYEEFGERLSKSEVSYWCRRAHRPSGRVRYELKVGSDLAWLLGVLVGDGSKCFRHGNSYYSVELHGRPEIVELFARTAAKVFGRDPLPIRPTRHGKVRARFQCIQLYYLLTNFKGLRELVESSLETVRSFLQGLWDAEGSISGRELVLSNTDSLLLLWVQELHSKLGIETTEPYLATRKGSKLRDPETGKEYERKKDVYCIKIKARSLKAFYEKVGFRLPRKRRKLEEALGIA